MRYVWSVLIVLCATVFLGVFIYICFPEKTLRKDNTQSQQPQQKLKTSSLDDGVMTEKEFIRLKTSGITFLYQSVTPTRSIAATTDCVVVSVSKIDGKTVAVIESLNGTLNKVAFEDSSVIEGETIWWDIMGGKNELFHRPQKEVIDEMWQASTQPAVIEAEASHKTIQ